MRTITIDKIPRLIKLRRKLEHELNVKISNQGKEFSVDGSAEDEYIAEKVLEAINMGFPLANALLIKNEDFVFEMIKIKHHTKRKDISTIKARIIGKKGMTLRILSNLTGCFFEIKDYEIGIIGHVEHIKSAQDAITSLIRGSKQSNVYTKLERFQPIPILDLGLKENIGEE